MRKTLSCLLLLSSPAFAGVAPVVGGHPATAGEWPDVALVIADDALCTGTLVAPDVVLTAGHCIGIQPKVVLLGSIDYAQPTGEVIDVKSATAYPDWAKTYDVGVLVLDHASKATPRALAGACTIREHLTADAKVHVVGFGLTDAAGSGDNSALNEADIAVTDASCGSDPACNAEVAPDGEFAAGGSGTDSCFGDSGGPVYVPTTQGPALAGVVSRGTSAGGDPCGGGGIYVRADQVAAWIEKTTGRTLAHSTCDDKADGEPGDEPAPAGGCSAGGGAAGGALLVIAAALWLTRRREAKLRR